jgi:glycosyltransferase involved in cell wall biosynthesis
VLSVVDNLELNGAREIIMSDLRSLDARRFEVGVLTLANDLEAHRYVVPDEVVPLSTTYRSSYGWRSVDYVLESFLMREARRHGDAAIGEIGSFAPQILHFHGNPQNLALGILASRQVPTALVLTEHMVRMRSDDYARHSRLALALAYRRLYRHYHVLSAAGAVEAYLRSFRLLNPSRHHAVLENEVDLTRFAPPQASPPSDGVHIVQVARIGPRKGTETVIRAFGRLNSDGHASLTLVGPDDMGGAMQRLAQDCVPEDREVRFLGPRDDVPDLLRRASIGVLVSRREGMPLAVLEMMATALPVIVSDIPEMTDVVSDGETGLVVPLDDVEALVSAIERLGCDPKLRHRLGTAARRSVERMAGKRIPQLEAFYERVAGNLRTRAGA